MAISPKDTIEVTDANGTRLVLEPVNALVNGFGSLVCDPWMEPGNGWAKVYRIRTREAAGEQTAVTEGTDDDRPPDQLGEDARDALLEHIWATLHEPPADQAWKEQVRGWFEQVGWVHVSRDDGSLGHTFVATSFVDPEIDQPVFRLRPEAGEEGGRMSKPVLDTEEEEAMRGLLTAYNRIRRWGLRANNGELESAVHVIQGFIIQHMLGRVAPEHWSQWFDSGEEGAVTDA